MLTSYDGHQSKCPSPFSNHILKQKHNETIRHLISIVFLFCGLIAWEASVGMIQTGLYGYTVKSLNKIQI